MYDGARLHYGRQEYVWPEMQQMVRARGGWRAAHSGCGGAGVRRRRTAGVEIAHVSHTQSCTDKEQEGALAGQDGGEAAAAVQFDVRSSISSCLVKCVHFHARTCDALDTIFFLLRFAGNLPQLDAFPLGRTQPSSVTARDHVPGPAPTARTLLRAKNVPQVGMCVKALLSLEGDHAMCQPNAMARPAAYP
jgi:hypothetical protein